MFTGLPFDPMNSPRFQKQMIYISSAFEGSSIQSHTRHLLRTSRAVAIQSGNPLGKQKTGHLDIQVCFCGHRKCW